MSSGLLALELYNRIDRRKEKAIVANIGAQTKPPPTRTPQIKYARLEDYDVKLIH